MPELYTLEEVAKILKVSDSQVKELARQRGLPVIRGIGRGGRVIDEDLWEWLRRQREIQEDERED